jgi:dynein heavy chain
MFGLHPNAEIGYLTTQGETLFSTIAAVSGGSGGAGGDTTKVKQFIASFLEQLPPDFNMLDIMGKTKERTPYIIVCFQECERMNILTKEIKTSLLELDAGLKGQLNITDAMEATSATLNFNTVPDSWVPVSYFSKKNLIEWFADLLIRIQQLQAWSEELQTPIVVWLAGLFNPMSYLTAIKQVTARSGGLPLDEMELKTDILNTRNVADLPTFAESGAYINGFFLEGAAWEMGRGGEQGYLQEMILKELHPELPIMHVTAVERKDFSKVGMYNCPVYVTTMRGPTYVFTACLKMESEDSSEIKWNLAGCALLMSPE